MTAVARATPFPREKIISFICFGKTHKYDRGKVWAALAFPMRLAGRLGFLHQTEYTE